MTTATTIPAALPLDAHRPEDRDTLRDAYVAALLAAHRGEPGAAERAGTIAERLGVGNNVVADLRLLQKALKLHEHISDRRARAAELKAVETHAAELNKAEADIRAATERRDDARRALAESQQLVKQSAAWAGELQNLLRSKAVAGCFAALT